MSTTAATPRRPRRASRQPVAPSACRASWLEPQHQVFVPAQRDKLIAASSHDRYEIDFPARARILDDHEPRPKLRRCVAIKWRKDHVLQAFDIDLQGIDGVDALAGKN